MKPSEMRKLVEQMKAEGSLPDLDTVLDAVAEVRKEYAPKMKAAGEKKHE
jgi:hypothetical protein